VQPRADGGESVHARPALDLSEEVFAEAPVTEAEEPEPAAEAEEPAADEAPTGPADPTGAGIEPVEPAEEAPASDEE
jgi:hypothetical protein